MNENISTSDAARPPFAWRALTSVLITVSFAILLLTGVILFLSPPGRIANWTNWAMLGLRKTDWTALHIWFSTLFLLAAMVHLLFNWRPLLGYFKSRLTRTISFRWEWALAVLICAGVFLGTRANVPPFSSLMAFNERIKQSWDQPQERAPIPHAELLTVAQLSEKAGLKPEVAIARLTAAGIQRVTPEIVVQTLAEANQRPAKQLYDLMLAAPAAKAGDAAKGHGGAGGGPGQKTLAEFCAEEGIDVQGALTRLRAKGYKAAADQNLREMAVDNGLSRPFELLEIIRAK